MVQKFLLLRETSKFHSMLTTVLHIKAKIKIKIFAIFLRNKCKFKQRILNINEKKIMLNKCG